MEVIGGLMFWVPMYLHYLDRWHKAEMYKAVVAFDLHSIDGDNDSEDAQSVTCNENLVVGSHRDSGIKRL
jgi:hypothetical protein